MERDFERNELTEEDLDSKTWVFLDSYMIKWSKFDKDIQKSTEKTLLGWLTSFKKNTSDAYRTLIKGTLDGNRISRLELSDSDLESVVIVPTDI